ncbi:MAG: hypothetical protein NTU66_06845 [Elusimicrobia bacterium]|nr:hypothetical protein [Elusimicrobiota bacterium]
MKSTPVLVFMLVGTLIVPSLSAANKQDVTDPVLQEIIASFSPRMSRFIDKHGPDLFVSDEGVTRASLMMALYEYDKSVKVGPTREYASKLELADLKSRLAILEKSASASGRLASNNREITQMVNELTPVMPTLLDSSLNNSQVFTKLKNDVLANQSSGGAVAGKPGENPLGLAELTRRVDQLDRNTALSHQSMTGNEKSVEITELVRRVASIEQSMSSHSPVSTQSAPVAGEISELSRRVARVEQSMVSQPGIAVKNIPTAAEVTELSRRVVLLEKSSPAASSSSAKGGVDESVFNDEIQKTRLQEKRDIAKLEKRLGEVERVSYSGKSSGDETKHYSSLLTKVSFGLSMLAALFIAR